jgi:Protein of unknown function (DUF1203)
MPYQISGLDPHPFIHLFTLSNAELAAMDIDRHIADEELGYPCRVSLSDATIGEELLLLNFQHLSAHSPYQSKGPIFVSRNAAHAPARAVFHNQLPPVLAQPERLFSIRAYDSTHRIIDAEVANGAQLQALLERFLSKPQTDYLHIHFARRGCFIARVDRA